MKYDDLFLARYHKKVGDVVVHHGVPFIFDHNDGWCVVPTTPPITKEITSFPRISQEAPPMALGLTRRPANRKAIPTHPLHEKKPIET
jgi:hypothetical protein